MEIYLKFKIINQRFFSARSKGALFVVKLALFMGAPIT